MIVSEKTLRKLAEKTGDEILACYIKKVYGPDYSKYLNEEKFKADLDQEIYNFLLNAERESITHNGIVLLGNSPWNRDNRYENWEENGSMDKIYDVLGLGLQRIYERLFSIKEFADSCFLQYYSMEFKLTLLHYILMIEDSWNEIRVIKLILAYLL